MFLDLYQKFKKSSIFQKYNMTEFSKQIKISTIKKDTILELSMKICSNLNKF